MCEAFLKHYEGDCFDAKSAGLGWGELNLLTVNNQRKI
jgi:hypothetical protein